MSSACRLKRLVLKPTIYCFHKCSYCDPRQDYFAQIAIDNNKGVDRKENCGFMPLEMGVRSIDEAAALGMTSLQLSGGDPLLYPQLIDLIETGSSHPGVFVFMNSVGTNVTYSKARDIIDAGLGAWNFSVDTLNANKYEEIRGVRGAFGKIMKAIQTVRSAASYDSEFSINYMAVITRNNYQDLPGLVQHCVDTGVASIHLMNVDGDTENRHLLSEKDIAKFRESIMPAILEVLRKKQLPSVVQENAINVLESFFSRENSDSNYASGIYWSSIQSPIEYCSTPYNYALVEPDGRVLPCCPVELFHDGEVGRLSESRSLSEVWNGDGYSVFRTSRLEYCKKCSTPRQRTLGLIPRMCRQFNE